MKHPGGPHYSPDSAAALETMNEPRADAPIITVPVADPASLSIETGLAPALVIERLSRMSKRGKLAGFVSLPSANPERPSFRVLAFGGIYDHELIGAAEPLAEGSRIRFELRLLRKMPIIAIVLTILTFWPGLPLTDSMLTSYFSWYRIETWWWYMPLAVLSLPLMWKQYKASVAAAKTDALDVMRKMAKELDGRVS